MKYSNVFGSNFPLEVIPVGTKKDVDDSVQNIIQQYYQLVESGQINDAYTLYEINKELLEPYMINMKYTNRLEEEIYNVGLMALIKATVIIHDKEPAYQSEGGFWYKEV